MLLFCHKLLIWLNTTHQVYDSIISQFQALVSEFAKELLIAEYYYKDDSDFWVDRLRMLTLNRPSLTLAVALPPTSSSDAVQQLFNAHMDIL